MNDPNPPLLCVVCRIMGQHIGSPAHSVSIDCPRCGTYSLHRDLANEMRQNPHFAGWHRVSAWLRQQRDAGASIPHLEEPLANLLGRLPRYGPLEQMDMLLQLIAARSHSYAVPASIELEPDSVLLWAQGADEVRWLLEALQEHGWITGNSRITSPASLVQLTPNGHGRLGDLAASSVLNDQLFVAMWFPAKGHEEHDRLLAAYSEGMLLAIDKAGYRPFRVDKAPITRDRIDAKIMVDIRRSRGLLADLTGHRANVTYEAGFAEGIGRPVLWSVRADWLEKLPFDVRQFPFLVWETPAQIIAELPSRIENLLGIRRNR